MPQGPRLQNLMADVKSHVREVTAEEACQRQQQGATLIDVREAEDFSKEHAAGALHLSRGTIELKIEEKVPDAAKALICYCGGGTRSALVAESLQRMGYTNVTSLAGGFKAWKDQGLPTDS